MLRAALRFGLFLLLTPVALFASAGALDWPEGWTFVVLGLLAGLVSWLIAWRRHPDLLKERARAIQNEEVPRRERLLVALVGLFGPLLVAVVAGLDRRLGWLPEIASWLRWMAAIGVAIGYGLGVWAMAVTPFFSAVVRIQEERGQKVIELGPYRWVRHPAYAGGVLAGICMPLMLGSVWALVPAAFLILALIMRTVQEDAVLAEELQGYRAYMERAPYRLLPKIW